MSNLSKLDKEQPHSLAVTGSLKPWKGFVSNLALDFSKSSSGRRLRIIARETLTQSTVYM